MPTGFTFTIKKYHNSSNCFNANRETNCRKRDKKENAYEKIHTHNHFYFPGIPHAHQHDHHTRRYPGSKG